MKRFFLFHFLFPFLLCALIIIHLFYLHFLSSNNPLSFGSQGVIYLFISFQYLPDIWIRPERRTENENSLKDEWLVNQLLVNQSSYRWSHGWNRSPDQHQGPIVRALQRCGTVQQLVKRLPTFPFISFYPWDVTARHRK